MSKNNSSTAILEVSSEYKLTMDSRQDSKENDYISNCSNSLDSFVASPSIDSFSTIPDQDFSLNDSRDLQVHVDNPQKHVDTLETYITFRITTKTTRPEFEENEFVVRRRYKDFMWLRQKLVDAFPTHLIPVLPAKHSLLAQLDRYSKEFIFARMGLLNQFLTRIVNHDVLSFNTSVKVFLSAKPSEFSIHRKSGSRQGIISRFSSSFQNLANVYILKSKSQEFESIKFYVDTLGEKLSSIDKIGQRIHRENQDYSLDLNQLHPILTLWSSSEPHLMKGLSAIASAIERNAQEHNNLVSSYNPKVEQPLREYLLYLDAIKEALNRRDYIEMEYEITLEELNKKRVEKDQLQTDDSDNGKTSLWKKTPEAKEDRLLKLGQTIPQLVKQVEDNQDKVECANENLRADLERWNIEKRADLKKIFLELANQNIKYYEKCLASWETALPEIKATEYLNNTSIELTS